MSIDYAALWILTVVNAVALLLVVRQLALLPRYSQPAGPRLGRLVPDWTLKTLEGRDRPITELPSEYVALFTAEGCGPCHTLFNRLAHEGRPRGPLVVFAEGDAQTLAATATGAAGPLYEEFLGGVTHEMMLEFSIPSTPFAVAIRHGRVAASVPARTRDELANIGTILGPALAASPAPARN